MKMLKFVPFALLTALLLIAGKCPESHTADDDSAGETPSQGTDSPTAPLSALAIEFSELSFTHTYGASPCPQDVGTIVITNTTDTQASYTITDSNYLVQFDGTFGSSTQGTVAPGQSVTIVVQFNCSGCPAAGLASTITVNVTNGLESNEQSKDVAGTFVGCP